MKTCVLFGVILLIVVSIGWSYNTSDEPFFSYGQGQQSKDMIITIPKGSANPEVDITNLTPKQWYDPREITVDVNDTIIWTNNDTESHTVTSGTGGGLNSLLSNSKGKPDGLFDSGLFGPDKTTSIKFNQSGIYHYFCTVHPWMEGIVRVQGNNTNVPSYAVDEFQKKIADFPLYNFTDNDKVEIGLSWAPSSITTNVPVNFLMDFFEYPQNTRMHLWPYNFVILQNNTEIYRTSDIAQVGSSSQTFAFNSTGPTIIKIESADNKSSFVQFGTTVYKNPYNTSKEIQNVSNSSFSLLSPLNLVYFVYAIIIVLPLFLVTIIILYRKKKI
ncbi:Amicyanin-alpha precursor [Candidatus Nitrosocosmicus oleophilus]|uniref:Amicyanin-alpha n=1 Tax=Candidatus Nitrosocosmicus oleophilus TaxID=1353260 RepID=A0A654M4Z9_9ARCH|nr:plastocyanin/azurin family copper-binding protein [Candidatus Nitrosocosmicus oleophilus]ALI37883.1 Amicyanin-alpha precursor [Candidatus Nitrosocosmicus oleophilus]